MDEGGEGEEKILVAGVERGVVRSFLRGGEVDSKLFDAYVSVVNGD